MRDGAIKYDGIEIDTQNVEWYQSESVCHDAAAAHALMQAMEQIMPEVEQHEIEGRADELLREGGGE